MVSVPNQKQASTSYGIPTTKLLVLVWGVLLMEHQSAESTEFENVSDLEDIWNWLPG